MYAMIFWGKIVRLSVKESYILNLIILKGGRMDLQGP